MAGPVTTRTGAPPPLDPGEDGPSRGRRARKAPAWMQVLAVVLTAAFLLAGMWLFSSELATDGQIAGIDASIVWAVGFFVVASVILGKIRKEVPGIALAVRATFLAVVVGFGVYWFVTSRDDVVDEEVVTAVEPAGGASQDAAAGGDAETGGTPAGDDEEGEAPARPKNVLLSRGSFVDGAHPGRGTARVIDRADGGKVLTLTGFETDAGPDLRVYLSADDPSPGGETSEFVDLGKLKGNKGDQQYDVPGDLDVSRYDTVVIWCKPFSVNFTQAKLERR